MIQQLTLWDEPVGRVWFDGSLWCATINDWWYAQGATEADAVKRVIANYQRELEAQENG